jgi:rhodanese-related sulfurtransferase
MREITVDQVEDALSQGATVVDVREHQEYADAHVPGVVPIPLGQLPARAPELDRTAPVYLICASGNRSAAAQDFLIQAGFDAVNVAGGTRAWAQSGRPLERG